MPNKHTREHTIFSGITSAEGVLENTSANSRLINTQALKTNNTMVGWIVGKNYPNNVYPFGSEDFRTGKMLSLWDEDGEVLDRFDVDRMDQTFSYFITTGRTPEYYEEMRKRRSRQKAKLQTQKDKK